MIDISALPIFLSAVLLLGISPGPDLVLITTYASTRGFKSGLMVSGGIFVAGMMQTLLVAFGLGKLLQAIPPLALAVRILGAAYLAWLGINLLRSWTMEKGGQSRRRAPECLTNRELACRGLLNNMMNPKALLFFSVFLPQFTSPQGDLPSQIMLLGTLLSAVCFCTNVLFALACSRLGSLIGRKIRLGRHVDGLLGMVFLGLAARLATSK